MAIDLSDAFSPLHAASTPAPEAKTRTSGIALTVGGKVYTGWTTARVMRGIESVSGSFSLSVSERWQNQNQPWPINDGDECTLSIDNETLITGYVDARKPSYNATDHTLEISGRDKTGLLVDCGITDGPWAYANADLFAVAKKLCAPFGVGVSELGVALPGQIARAVGKFSVNAGDTVFSVLEQLARLAGVLLISDGQGGLIITAPGTERATTELVEGQNIKSADADFNSSGRFATYVVLGQHATTDEYFGHEATHIRASATDPNVANAARTMVVRPEGNVTLDSAKKRVQWEATVRAARANSLTVTVQGWTQADGAVWPINALVRVRSPLIGVDGDMLITQASYNVSDSEGTVTVLSLKPPNAFIPEPIVKPDGVWKEVNGLR